jgi:hypothetical protein
MLRTITAITLGTAAAALIAAPTSAADTTDITNADIAQTPTAEVLLIPTAGGPHPYATGYNISPRYEFRTDPVTGDRRAKFDNGCNGAC